MHVVQMKSEEERERREKRGEDKGGVGGSLGSVYSDFCQKTCTAVYGN